MAWPNGRGWPAGVTGGGAMAGHWALGTQSGPTDHWADTSVCLFVRSFFGGGAVGWGEEVSRVSWGSRLEVVRDL